MTSRRQTYALVFAFMLCVTAAFAQSPPIADPASVGMSAERLARIDPVLSRAVEDGDIVGIVAMVARHGSVVYLHAEGMADRETDRPMKLSTRFRMASMTKPITSVGVMMLFEEGAFLLNDPVSDYLPEFSNPYVLNNKVEADGEETHTLVPAERPITIHHLLTHTSGIAYPIFSGGVIGDLYDNAGVWDGLGIIDSTIEEGVRRIASVPLNHHPGDQFTYGLSIDVLGRLIEVVSGMSFADFLRVRMFEPLGMDDTAFHVDDELEAAFATPYEERETGMSLLDSDADRATWARYPFDGPGTYFSGGAGLSSTVHDYGRFCQALLNGGELDGARILSPRTVALMTTNHIRDLPYGGESGSRFGLGFHLAGPQSGTQGIGSEGSYGWGGYYGTTFSIDPAEDMFLIALTQTQSPGSGRFNGGLFPNLVYQAIVGD